MHRVGRLKLAMAAMLAVVAVSGCAPRDWFSAIDRHCFVADWTNHHSFISCCKHNRRNPPAHTIYGEMKVLGDPPPTELTAE